MLGKGPKNVCLFLPNPSADNPQSLGPVSSPFPLPLLTMPIYAHPPLLTMPLGLVDLDAQDTSPSPPSPLSLLLLK